MPKHSVNNLTSVFTCLLLLGLSIIRLQVDGRAGHMDEYDYLFVGKTLLAGNDWPTHTYIFGWDLNWMLLAWGDLNLGGISGARLIASLLGIVSIAGMYCFALVLWRNRTIALFAALLLSMEGAHLYTSRLATYDVISFTFFVWSLPAVLLACKAQKHRWLWTLLSAALLVAAVLSKYTALLYLPFIAVIVFFNAPKQAIAGIFLITSALGAYVLMHFDQLEVLYNIQINGAHEKNATTLDIVIRSARQLPILLFFSALSIGYSLIYARTVLPTILLLVIMGIPLFAYHLLGQNVISLQKHLVYSSLFLIPAVAWGLQRITENIQLPSARLLTLTGALLIFGLSNYQQLRTMQTSYPNVQAFVPFAQHIQTKESVLSEDPYLFRYLLHDKVSQSQINETTWLDNNGDGLHQHLDVQHAVWDRKFDYVFLNDQQHADGNAKLRDMLMLRGYATLLYQPYELTTMSGTERSGVMSLHARTDSSMSLLISD